MAIARYLFVRISETWIFDVNTNQVHLGLSRDTGTPDHFPSTFLALSVAVRAAEN